MRARHLAILNQGVKVWNRWRRTHPFVHPNLSYARPHHFKVRDLEGIDFSYTNLCHAELPGVNLRRASSHQAILAAANLSRAHLEWANFCRTDLYGTDLSGAWLTNANLQGVQLAGTRLAGAHLRGCTVYGLSAWDIRDQPAEEDRLRIRYTAATERRFDSDQGASTPDADDEGVEKEARVDGIDLASFIYLTLSNRNISRIIDAAGKKWVLILGNFTQDQQVLEAIEKRLKKLHYIPIIFDFPPPERRDLIETLLLLAGLSAFVIVDMTHPRSTPLEVQAIAPNYGIPILPLVRGSALVPAMMSGLQKYRWVQTPLKYKTEADLCEKLERWVSRREKLEEHRSRAWKAAMSAEARS